MVLADLAQDAIIFTTGWSYHHPKYVGIIRKVDAGMVSAAGKFIFLPFPPPHFHTVQTMSQMHTSYAHAMCVNIHIFSPRFFHVLQPEADPAVAGRRASVPTVSSNVVYVPPDRRGSEPALLQAEVTSEQECSRSELFEDLSNPQRDTGHLRANIVEEQSEGTGRFHRWKCL